VQTNTDRDRRVELPSALVRGQKRGSPITVENTLFYKRYILAFIGRTIGLFTGLSLISAAEVIYWFYRTINSRMYQALPQKSTRSSSAFQKKNVQNN
jgi:hypothetical protein